MNYPHKDIIRYYVCCAVLCCAGLGWVGLGWVVSGYVPKLL